MILGRSGNRPYELSLTTGMINGGFKDHTGEAILSRGPVFGVASAMVHGERRTLPHSARMDSLRRIRTIGTPAVEQGLGVLADHVRKRGSQIGWNCRSLALAVLGLPLECSFGVVDLTDQIGFEPISTIAEVPVGQVVRMTKDPRPSREVLGANGPEHWVVRVNPAMTLSVLNAEGPVAYLNAYDLQGMYQGWSFQAASRIEDQSRHRLSL